MDNPQTFKIKIEKDINEATGNDVYEEYSVTYQNCKQEEEHRLYNEVPSDQHPNQAQTANATLVAPAVKLNCHIKRKLVNHFLTNGCSSKSYNDAIKRFSKEKVEAYKVTVNRVLKEAQEYVYQECESLCFVNISDWLEVFKKRNVPGNSFYEPGIVLNAIANNENHPNKAAMEGVDLKAVYTFLSNGLMGLPQKSLDPISAKFLAVEFESLINDANSDFADSQTVAMKERLQCLLPQKVGESPPSLDPLFLLEDTILHDNIFSK